VKRLALLLALGACAVLPAQAQFFGGRGGGVRTPVALVARYDKNGDGRLNAAERHAALADLLGGNAAAVLAARAPVGPALLPAQVRRYGDDVPLYDAGTLRTLFLYFDDADWETELEVFKGTDVEVPATAVVDAHSYRDVGVRFHGTTSFSMVGAGQKRSFNLSFNFVHGSQRLLGHSGLTLLNAAADPTFLRSVLYMQVMRDYIPAPQANYLRVVINGESWGVYVNQQQVDATFARAAGGAAGPRWRIPGSPWGRGGLNYLGDDAAPYKRIYELKTRDKPESWAALIRLCKVLNQTPPEQLESALAPLLDVDGALHFLAVDNALLNGDGFWTRASDYNLYLDAQGRFHLTPHDANETLRPIEEMGWRRASATSEAGAVDLDPLVDASNTDKALLYRLLAVPALRARYLDYVHDVAGRWLRWERIGPLAARYQGLIAADVANDPHKLYSTESFRSTLTVDGEEGSGPIGPPGMSLRNFVERRRAYLLKYFGEDGTPVAAH
jgi:hypothetical protein